VLVLVLGSQRNFDDDDDEEDRKTSTAVKTASR
jgi:hypothetical protein